MITGRACVAAAAAMLLAGCSVSTGSTAGPTTSSATHTSTPPAAATHISHRVPLRIRVYRWGQSTRHDFEAISNDDGRIQHTAGRADVVGLLNACRKLKRDVVTFEADPAAPDRVLRADLARAMDHYSTAATECLTDEFESSAGEMNRGTRWIKKATNRISQLGH